MKILQYSTRGAIIILAALALTVTGCGKKAEKTEATEEHHEESSTNVEITDAQYKTAGIEIGKIETRVLSGTIRVNGKLDVPPQQLVSVSIPMGGILKSTELLEGSLVRKGQVIAVMEGQEYIDLQENYLDIKSQLEYAQADYQRQQTLSAENANAQKVLQQSKASYSSLKAKSEALAQKLKLLNISIKSLEERGIQSTITIYAPISGYVTQVNANIGKFVSPSEMLFEIVDTEHLHAELTVYEKDVRKLKIGQKVRFTLANETTERTAKVYLIGREISKERTVQIHCHIDRVDREMLPGMFLTAYVESGGQDLPSLPDEAIVDFEGNKYIFMAVESHPKKQHEHDEKESEQEKQELGDEHLFKMVAVQTGVSEQGFTEVALPVNAEPNSRIVLKGAYSLLAKLKNSEDEGHSH